MTDAQKQRTGFWLLPMWAGKDRDRFAEAMKRVAGEITTTFATSYSKRDGCPGFSAAALGCLNGSVHSGGGGDGAGGDGRGAAGVREAGDGEEVPAQPVRHGACQALNA